MALSASLRVAAATLLVCSGLYAGAILAVGQAVVPDSANGSLIERNGQIVGSRQIGQKFEGAQWLWPRPSAVDWNGSGAGGSNTSPTNPALTERAQQQIARYGASAARPLPAELATASGAGLDPHVSLEAALYQAPRIAAARGVPVADVERALRAQAAQVPLSGGAVLVNVLEANLALGPLR